MNQSILAVAVAVLVSAGSLNAQGHSLRSPNQAQAMSVAEWSDEFNGNALDATKWERFTFEGPGGGVVRVEDGLLHLKGLGGSRFGVRSLQEFSGARFIVEAKLPHPPKQAEMPMGFATIAIMFDTAGRNRLEWIWRSDGHFEAWKVIDGRSEQLDNRRLATKESSPTLAIARRGDELMFLLNGEVGLQKTITNLPARFHVMLYGFGTSEDDWDSVRVVTPK